jgi:hypothetical protein
LECEKFKPGNNNKFRRQEKEMCANLNRIKKFLFVFVTILGISFYDEAAKMNPIQEFSFAFVCFLSQRIA